MNQEILITGVNPGASGTLTLCVVRQASDSSPRSRFSELAKAEHVEQQLAYALYWFKDASLAVHGAVEIVAKFPGEVSIGIASGIANHTDEYEDLRSLASAIADVAERGQILICLATHELTRKGLRSPEEFSEIGNRSVASGHVARLFLYTSEAAGKGLGLGGAPGAWNPRSFIGRAREIDALKADLTSSRFVYLSGPPGIGKTSLVARVAKEVEDDYGDGILWINLSEVTRRSMVLHRLAAVLEIPYRSEKTLLKQIVRTIGPKSYLIVFDDMGLVEDEVEEIAERLLTCANTAVICTSAKRPSSSSPRSIVLDGLNYPLLVESFQSISDYDAVKFFVQRGRMASQNFALTERNFRDVLEIIHRMEGSPWAIQMVASRLALLSPKVLLARLRDDPFGILTDRNPQENTLFSALKTVLDTLNPWSQALYKTLWMFQGIFSSEAVLELCPDDALPRSAILASLKDLLDVHLIHPFPISEDRRVFAMGSVSKEFSQRQTSLEDQKRLKTKMATFLTRRGTELFGNGLATDTETIQEFEILYEDFREKWLADAKSKKLIAGVIENLTRCGSYWIQQTQFKEGLEILNFVSSQAGAPAAPKFLNLINLMSWLCIKSGDDERTRALLRPAMRTALQEGDRLQMAKLLTACSAYFSNVDRPRSAVRVASYIFQCIPPEGSMFETTKANMASLLAHAGKYAEAKDLVGEISQMRSQAGTWFDVYLFSTNAFVDVCQGNVEAAIHNIRTTCKLLGEHPYDETLPSIYLTGCRLFLENNRFHTAAELLMAVREMNERYGFFCPKRRVNLMQRYDALLGNSKSPLLDSWDYDRPLKLLENCLDSW